MRQRIRQSGNFRTFALLAAVSLFVPSLSAQESEIAPNSLVHSAKLMKDRVAQAKFERAELAVKRGQLVEAVGLARELAGSEAGTWVLVRSVEDEDGKVGDAPHEVWRSAPQAAFELLGRLGPAGREQYRAQQEAAAKAALERAIESGRTDALREVVVRYRPLRQGLTALRFLAAQSLDRGRPHTALSAIRQILRHPLLSDAERKAAQRGREAAQRLIGQPAGAGQGESAKSKVTQPDDLPDIATLVPFRSKPLWEIPVAVGDGTANAISDALHEHTLQSIPRVLRARPIVAGEDVLIRAAGQIQRVDVQTGNVQWELAASTSATSAGTRINNNLSMQNLMARNLAKELQIDTVATQLHLTLNSRKENRSLVYVESTPQTTLPHLRQGAAIRVRAVGPFGSRVVVPTKNRIARSSLETGQTDWVFSGREFFAKEKGIASSDEELERIYFLGPPTPVDDLFCGMAQVGQSIRLYALNSNGQLAWQTTLCETGRELQQNVDWRFLACPVVPAGGVLLCPTSTGIVVGFDLVTRTPLWARRYLRDDVVEMSDILIKRQGPSVTRQWWRCWRELAAKPVSVNGEPHVVLASPDRRGLSLLNVLTGQEAWHWRVAEPLSLIAVTKDQAVFAEPNRLTGLDLPTGEVAWQTPVPEITGRGYITSSAPKDEQKTAQDFYVFPSQDRRLNAVRLADGALLRTALEDASPAGNLTRVGDVVVEQTADKITAWRMLDAYSEDSKFDSATVAESLATAGQFASAVDRWQKLLSSNDESVASTSARRKVEQRYWQTLLKWLATEPAARELIAPKLRELAGESGVRRQIELSQSLARSRAASEDRVAALDRFFQTLNLNPAGDEAVYSRGNPLRMVRQDRQLQGELLDLIPADEAQSQAVMELRSRFAEQLQQARSSPDPFAAQRLAELLNAHPWAATLRLDEKAEVGRTFLQKQISLLQLAESDDSAVAARALERLAELYGDRSHELDATASTLRLVDRLSGKVSAMTRDLLARPDEIPDRESLIEKLKQSDWDGLTASAEIQTRSAPASNYVRVSVECEAGSLFDRLEVAVTSRVQKNKRTIRFCGDGEAGAWKLDVPVPQTAASRAFMMPRGWGIGHLLILETGGELLAISPYSRNGEPKPVLVWSRDIIEGNRLASPQIRKGIPGFQLAALNYLDPFDRPMAVTGPVRSGYLCVQTRGRLVCLDTVTGKQFWERYGLPAEAVVSGDAESVFLIDKQRGQVQQLRVIDGAAVASHSLPGFGKSDKAKPTTLSTNGSRLLVRHGDDDDSPAEVLDLKTGQVAWSLPDGARHLFRADLNTIGYLSAEGELVLCELASGVEVSRMKPDLPDTVDGVECVRDRKRWFIAIHSVKNATAPAVRYASVAPLNGPLIAISRTDGRVLWQEYIKDAQLPLVQHGTVPILVLAWTQQSKRVPANNRVVDTVYHLIDKRSGETILEDQAVGNNATFLIEPDPAGRRVEIQTNRRTFRVEFAEAK